MFEGLSKLLVLSVSNNQISCVSPLAFQPLISLQTVELDFNFLHQMSDFAPILQLPNLDFLNLKFNKLTSFHSDDLNVSNLKKLDLFDNPLRKFSISSSVFPRLESLQLSVRGSDFAWDVPDKRFLRNLSTLSGSETSLETYRAVLQSADTAQTLILSSMSKWTHGVSDVAWQLLALRILDLCSNTFGRLSKSLQACSELTDLDLSSDELTDLPERCFRPLTRLRRLTLSDNLLSGIPVALRSLSTLEILDLSFNDISELGCSDFLNLTRLTELNLSSNHISVLRGCIFQNLKALAFLNAQQNMVFTLADTFKAGLHKLQVLKLQGNHLKNLRKGDLRGLSSLRSLELQAIQFSNVHSEAFEGLDDLRTLSLSSSCYTREMFAGVRRLENLSYFSNIERCPQINHESPFSDLFFLKNLFIKNFNRMHVRISADLLKGLGSLENFSVYRFFVKSPHVDTFKHTPGLRRLQISRSHLLGLSPGLFQPVSNLQVLDLSNNRIGSLDFLVQANLSALRQLKLSQNALTVINVTLFRSLPALIHLELLGNPFTCDCTNSDFIQWLQSNNQTQVVDAHQYTCTFPLSKHGSKFRDFDTQSCWIDASFLCYISTTCLIVLTMLTSFIYHFLQQQMVYAYFLFLAFLYDSRKRKKGAPHRYDAFVSYNVETNAEAWRPGSTQRCFLCWRDSRARDSVFTTETSNQVRTIRTGSSVSPGSPKQVQTQISNMKTMKQTI
ncbi:hypothetical protein LDENG_00205090 [Lucifuga dentata]|nr:hypothetical protein LDENG_00205090 [Lucifuga dentata]